MGSCRRFCYPWSNTRSDPGCVTPVPGCSGPGRVTLSPGKAQTTKPDSPLHGIYLLRYQRDPDVTGTYSEMRTSAGHGRSRHNDQLVSRLGLSVVVGTLESLAEATPARLGHTYLRQLYNLLHPPEWGSSPITRTTLCLIPVPPRFLTRYTLFEYKFEDL